MGVKARALYTDCSSVIVQVDTIKTLCGVADFNNVTVHESDLHKQKCTTVHQALVVLIGFFL